MTTRTRNIAIAIIGAALIVGGIFIWRRGKTAPSTTPIKTRLLWLNQAQFAGLYAAKEAGFYQKKGLDVSIIPGGPGINPVRMVASGSEDIGIASGSDIILARDKGIPVRALAIVVRENPTSFFAKKESGIASVKDFAGKRIGVKVGFELEYYLTAMMKAANVQESQVKRIPIQFDMTPFFRGDVDVWCGYRINEPNIAREQGVQVNEILPSDYGVNVVGDVIFTSEQFYQQHRDACWAFVDATYDGWNLAKQHPDQALKFTVIYNQKGDPKHETAMLASILPLIFVSGRTSFTDQNTQTWANMVSFLKNNNVIETNVDPDSCFWSR
ncbi:MAG TPA: ABC transporter substrate-binding protein [Pyrinomonadaceae bacterium]|nr:ABC transporter substrate-binding protein [Pyrinomonadaceae bacterium]